MVKKGNPQTDDNLSNLTREEALIRWPIERESEEEQAPAQSLWSTGRGCPKCAGQLKFREYIEESDTIILFCDQCQKVWHEPDLKEFDETGDNPLFRDIPTADIKRWMDAKEYERRKKEG